MNRGLSRRALPHSWAERAAAPISLSLAFESHSCASTVNATVGGLTLVALSREREFSAIKSFE